MKTAEAQVLEQDIPLGNPEFDTPAPASQTGLVTQPQATKEIAAQEPQTMTDQLISMAIDKDLDIEKLQRLIDMKDAEEKKTAKSQFDRSMAACQAKIQPVLADADNDQTGSKYSKLHTIVTALKPIYTAEGFSIAYRTEETPIQRLAEGGWFRVLAVISHVGGHSETHHVDLPADTKGIKGSVNKTMIHGIKSTISYARNILLGLIFNFVSSEDIDDDGNAAGAMQGDRKQRRTEKPPYPDERLERNKSSWCDLIESGQKTPAAIIATVRSAYTLTDEQVKTINGLVITDQGDITL